MFLFLSMGKSKRCLIALRFLHTVLREICYYSVTCPVLGGGCRYLLLREEKSVLSQKVHCGERTQADVDLSCH